MAEFRLPDLGEGVTEAEIDRWLVVEGQEIAEDDLLVEVVTDKATAEIPSPFAGVVTRIHVGEGDVVPVGTVLITVDDGRAGTPSSPPEPEVRSTHEAASPPQPDASSTSETAVKAMPPVRKLARELGMDIATVRGSGPGGRITRGDVEDAADGTRPAPALAASGERRVAFKGVRRMIAEHMAKAHRAIPAVTHVEECDVTELQATRRIANEREPDAPKLTFLPFIVKAVVAALRSSPEMNSSLDEDAAEIVIHERYDIGIAVDAPQGLVVPVIRGADAFDLRGLAAEIERLAAGARSGSLRAGELRGSTFSITSPGPFAGLMATPIINHPEAAILGVHRAEERPAVRGGQVVVREMMNLSITFDHRLVDGVTAARFLKEVVQLLEHPALIALR